MLDDRILDTTEGLLRDNAFTMARLAATLGISRVTLHRHTGGREALLQRLAKERGIPTADPPREMRARILRAARSVIVRAGISGTTMAQIAREAGIGPATVYRHFHDKARLLDALSEELGPRSVLSSARLTADGHYREGLVVLTAELLRAIHENRDLLWLGLQANRESPARWAHLREAPRRSIDKLAKLFRAGIRAGALQACDPGDLAFAYAGMVLSFAFWGPMHYDRPLTDPDAIARLIVRIALDGMGGTPVRGGRP